MLFRSSSRVFTKITKIGDPYIKNKKDCNIFSNYYYYYYYCFCRIVYNCFFLFDNSLVGIEKKMLEALSKVGLHLKPEKCEFHKTEVKYLGLIISADGVKVDPK